MKQGRHNSKTMGRARLVLLMGLLGTEARASEVECTETLASLATSRPIVLDVKVLTIEKRTIVAHPGIFDSAIELVEFSATVERAYRAPTLAAGDVASFAFVAPCNCDQDSPSSVREGASIFVFGTPPATYEAGSDSNFDSGLRARIAELARTETGRVVFGRCDFLPDLENELTEGIHDFLEPIFG